MNTTLISVVIATCNRPELALRAVNSVLAQTYPLINVIVVNNGSSPDNQRKYRHCFAEIMHQIDYVDVCHDTGIGLGPSRARNAGILRAKGEYVTFCDDDDEWIDPQYLQSVVQEFNDHKPAILFADQVAITHDGVIQKSHWFERQTLIQASGHHVGEASFYRLNPDYFYEHGGFPHLNITLYQKTLIEQWGGFCPDLTYEEDFEFFHRLLSHTESVMYFDQVVSRHHIPNPQCQSNVTTAMSEQDKCLARICIFNRLLMNSHRADLSRFAARQGSYAVGRVAEAAFQEGNLDLAWRMSRQAMAWRGSWSMGRLWIRLIVRWLRKKRSK